MAGSVLRRGKSLSCGCDIPKRISEKLYKDRVGQRFGELVILKRVENHPTMGIMFLCRCDCGNEKVISRVAIVSHGQRNCGCKLGGFVDLTGKKFNRWTVLTMFRDENNNIKWISECECGNIGIHSSYELTSGSSKSCGCYDYERKLQFECLEGKKFGRWIVISDKRNKNGERETICQCECGTIKPVDVGNLKKSISKYCECYRVEFIKSKTGENSPNWEGGKTSLNLYLRKVILPWKIDSLKRWNYKCAITGSKDNLKIHHVFPFNKLRDLIF